MTQVLVDVVPPALPGPPPIVGVRTREVLLELGFGRDEVDDLRARGGGAW